MRVLGCDGLGSSAAVIKGYEWVVANHNPSSGPAIISASLGGDKSHAEFVAARKVTEAGITMVVAAGNDNADACNGSPADAGGKNGDVVTVASSDKTEHRQLFPWIPRERANGERRRHAPSEGCRTTLLVKTCPDTARGSVMAPQRSPLARLQNKDPQLRATLAAASRTTARAPTSLRPVRISPLSLTAPIQAAASSPGHRWPLLLLQAP